MNHGKWFCITGTVIGDSHSRKGTGNQDAISSCELTGKSDRHILAVADGHGSPGCARSDVGAKLAVEVAIEILVNFCSKLDDRGIDFQSRKPSSIQLNSILSMLRNDVPIDLAELWGERVAKHLQENPLDLNIRVDNLKLLYGTTVIALVVSDEFILCLQLGDGDILIVNSDQTVSHLFSEAATKIGDETHSLCLPECHKRFNVEFRLINSHLDFPKAILVCTDGFSNAFKSEDSFRKAATDFCQLLETSSGQETVRNSLSTWLREYSSFSGDDVSVGLLSRSNATETTSLNIDKLQNEPHIST